MANEQLYIAIGVPIAFNAMLFAILFLNLKAGFDRLDTKFDAWFARLDARLKHLERR